MFICRLTCEKTFEAAEGNLKRLLDKSRAFYETGIDNGINKTAVDHQKMFLHTVLTLVSFLINNRATEEVARVSFFFSWVFIPFPGSS